MECVLFSVVANRLYTKEDIIGSDDNKPSYQDITNTDSKEGSMGRNNEDVGNDKDGVMDEDRARCGLNGNPDLDSNRDVMQDQCEEGDTLLKWITEY